jgi:hypothetical protein
MGVTWYAGKKRISFRVLVGKPKENRPETTLKTYTLVRVYQNGSSGSRKEGYGICSSRPGQDTGNGSCQHNREISGYLKWGFFGQARNYQFLKIEYAVGEFSCRPQRTIKTNNIC